MKKGFVYMMTNKYNRVLYTGVTSNLINRVTQHKNKTYKGFTSKYNCNKLVYFEEYDSISDAIIREKQIKNYSRNKKNSLIQALNPEWSDIFKDVISG